MTAKKGFLDSLEISLVVPVSIGNHLVGFLGLGPEFTGGSYGHDDFDLLTALGRQTASALMAMRMAEKLAQAREQQAWNRLSAFVLHDIKNAATMLSLLQENAPDHIHEPEFQQDMLELVDDSLKRMGRVQQRLKTFKDEINPQIKRIALRSFFNSCCRRLQANLPSLKIILKKTDDIEISSDPDLLASVIENLLLNASQAGTSETIVQIRFGVDSDSGSIFIECRDNGPGIPDELLPEILFEPFTTSKVGGSGVGLWHIKRMITSLGGTISAQNTPNSGANFVIRLPRETGVG
jgi:putative PEP-CTERM system histidine kinase